MESPDEVSVVVEDPHYVDMYIKEFTLTSLNKNGQPDYILTADLMEHFADTGESDITKPVFNINKDDNAWVISANHGTIDNDNIWVTLNDDVVMLQKNADNPLKLRTRKMRFNTKTQIANSNQQIHITQGALSLKSNGMIFDNINNKLELLAGVNGIYVKN